MDEAILGAEIFLVGVIETAKNAILKFTKVIALTDQLEKQTIMSMGRKLPKAKSLLHSLYIKPVITVSDVI